MPFHSASPTTPLGLPARRIKVAKALGAQVVTTVRNDAKAELAKSLGADLLINTRNEDLVARVMKWTDGRGVDIAIDNVGGDVLPKSIDAVKATGVVVAFGFTAGTEVTFDNQNFFFSQKQLRGSMASDIEDLRWGLEQIRQGKIKPVLDRTLPFKSGSQSAPLDRQQRCQREYCIVTLVQITP